MEPQMTDIQFAMLVLSTLLITAGGYIINDYFDRKIDRINKPEGIIVGNLIQPRHAMAYHLVFSITGVAIGVWLSVGIGQLYLSFIFFMVSGLLWFYSTTYKREFLLGNVVVALLTALVPFIVLVFELPLLAREYGASAHPITRLLLIWISGFSVFAFLLNLIREIVKDMEDLEGDKAFGKITVPVVWGMTAASRVAVSLILSVIALLIVSWIFFIRDAVTIVYFLLLIVFPLLAAAAMIIKGDSLSKLHQASFILKAVMMTGIGYMVITKLLM